MKKLFDKFCHWVTDAVEQRITPFIVVVILASCTKPACPAPEITEISGNVAYFQPAGSYTIEVQGIDGPYKGFLQVSGNSQRVEGEKLKVRIKSECSDWSQWVYKR